MRNTNFPLLSQFSPFSFPFHFCLLFYFFSLLPSYLQNLCADGFEDRIPAAEADLGEPAAAQAEEGQGRTRGRGNGFPTYTKGRQFFMIVKRLYQLKTTLFKLLYNYLWKMKVQGKKIIGGNALPSDVRPGKWGNLSKWTIYTQYCILPIFQSIKFIYQENITKIRRKSNIQKVQIDIFPEGNTN